MRSFTYQALPGRIVFAPGASRQKFSEEVDGLGAELVLLMDADRGQRRAGELAEQLGERVGGIFTGVMAHVPVEVAEAARWMVREAGADCLLCSGGGSTTGTAKAV